MVLFVPHEGGQVLLNPDRLRESEREGAREGGREEVRERERVRGERERERGREEGRHSVRRLAKRCLGSHCLINGRPHWALLGLGVRQTSLTDDCTVHAVGDSEDFLYPCVC